MGEARFIFLLSSVLIIFYLTKPYHTIQTDLIQCDNPLKLQMRRRLLSIYFLINKFLSNVPKNLHTQKPEINRHNILGKYQYNIAELIIHIPTEQVNKYVSPRMWIQYSVEHKSVINGFCQDSKRFDSGCHTFLYIYFVFFNTFH